MRLVAGSRTEVLAQFQPGFKAYRDPSRSALMIVDLDHDLICSVSDLEVERATPENPGFYEVAFAVMTIARAKLQSGTCLPASFAMQSVVPYPTSFIEFLIVPFPHGVKPPDADNKPE